LGYSYVCSGFVWVLYVLWMWTPHQIYGLQILTFPAYSLSFHFVDSFLDWAEGFWFHVVFICLFILIFSKTFISKYLLYNWISLWHEYSVLHPLFSFLFPSPLLDIIFRKFNYTTFIHKYKVFLHIHQSAPITLNFHPFPSHYTPPPNSSCLTFI
jgi:hypothetical protein